MYKILKKQKLADLTYLMKIHAPAVAKSIKPGQFVIIRISENDERIPLSLADNDKTSVTVVFLETGYTTKKLAQMKAGQFIKDFVGPLGNAMEIRKFGTVCLIGGGLGIAPLLPQAKELKKAGNQVICIIGTRSKKQLFWQKELQKYCDNLLITTDDGSMGLKGNVVDALTKVMQKKHIELVKAIGPPIMMKYVAKFTYQKSKTIASINSIMVDGIGMCGSCRVKVNDETKFACVDGPEFDAHQVDFDDLMNRNRRFDEPKILHTGCKIKK